MSSVMDIIADETNGISYKTYKYSFDGMDVPSFDYVLQRERLEKENRSFVRLLVQMKKNFQNYFICRK